MSKSSSDEGIFLTIGFLVAVVICLIFHYNNDVRFSTVDNKHKKLILLCAKYESIPILYDEAEVTCENGLILDYTSIKQKGDRTMSRNAIPSKVSVKVVARGFDPLPYGFPWANGVHVSLLGNMSDLVSIQRELESIKQVVNVDISKWGLRLKDFKIEITKAE
jgi:hypothetical protein